MGLQGSKIGPGEGARMRSCWGGVYWVIPVKMNIGFSP